MGDYLKIGVSWVGVTGWSFLLSFGFISLIVGYFAYLGVSRMGHSTGAEKGLAAGVGLLIGLGSSTWLIYEGINFWEINPAIGFGIVGLFVALLIYNVLKPGAGKSMGWPGKLIGIGIGLLVVGIALASFI